MNETQVALMVVEFFAVYTKLAEMVAMASKDLETAKKKLPPAAARPDAIDYYWLSSKKNTFE